MNYKYSDDEIVTKTFGELRSIAKDCKDVERWLKINMPKVFEESEIQIVVIKNPNKDSHYPYLMYSKEPIPFGVGQSLLIKWNKDDGLRRNAREIGITDHNEWYGAWAETGDVKKILSL